jgi:hypothetical protein
MKAKELETINDKQSFVVIAVAMPPFSDSR